MTTDQSQAPAPAVEPESPRKRRRRTRIAIAFGLAHVLGIFSSLDALMSTRTPQGAVAWIVSLNSFPVVSVPAYWVFGRTKFNGYISIRQELDRTHDEDVQQLVEGVRPFMHDFGPEWGAAAAGEGLAELPFLSGNAVELLVDGVATFDSIFAGIDAAEEYILVQFYIVRNDSLGRELSAHLIERARAGVQVWFLYDEIGSKDLPDAYGAALEQGGVNFRPFHSTRGSGNRFQLNFRNHRKIVVVDGRVGWVGGHNVGDEYVGRDPAAPVWRDTHMRLEGPAVLELQLSFLEDWHWAADELLSLPWEPWLPSSPSSQGGGEAIVLILPSGPADQLETASLMYQQAIHSANERIWIASPYFVPDEGVVSSLLLARLRGVDVRILIPDVPDSKLVYYSTYAFVDELIEQGIAIYRYEPGFLHEKTFLVDDHLAGVGTANFDNRSFRLNFEVTALVVDEDFVEDVEQMFEADFARARVMTLEDVRSKPWWFQALSRASYLAAPLQ